MISVKPNVKYRYSIKNTLWFCVSHIHLNSSSDSHTLSPPLGVSVELTIGCPLPTSPMNRGEAVTGLHNGLFLPRLL